MISERLVSSMDELVKELYFLPNHFAFRGQTATQDTRLIRNL